MRTQHLFAIALFSLLGNSICSAQETHLYKQIDTTRLLIEVHYPEQFDSTEAYPAMVFFFGGGWVSGDRNHFINHAKYFSKRGLVCFLVDYRTKSKEGTTPFESLKDAKSAIRFIRVNAASFSIDTSKIIAAGGSAGGHLAAASALITPYNESTDDLSINCIPNALVLFNPVIDNGPAGYGFGRVGEAYKDFSPLHNIKRGAPPTIILLGTEDELIPIETVEYYKTAMEKVGSRCDLKLHQDQPHGFFNYPNFNYYKRTLIEADEFLISLGYLEETPKVNIE